MGITSQKTNVMSFPVSNANISPLSGPFIAEIDIQNWAMYNPSQTFQLYQMNSNNWTSSDYWNTINPLITDTIIASNTTTPSYTYTDTNTYMKFDVSNIIANWLTVNSVTDVALTSASSSVFADTYWVSSNANIEPEIELWPYIVISASVPTASTNIPTTNFTNATTTANINHIVGNGLGVVSVVTNTAHNLQNGDLIGIVNTMDYNTSGVAVTVVDATHFTITIPSNTSTGVETYGVVLIASVVPCVAQGVDIDGISHNPVDLMVKKTESLTPVPVSVLNSSFSTVNFDFILNGIDDGYYQIQVKNLGGLYSSVIKPPIITQYLNLSSGNYVLYPRVFTSGDVLYLRGYNLTSFNQYLSVAMNSFNDGGLLPAGINTSINTSDINSTLNQISVVIPSGFSNEWDIGTIDYTNNSIQLLNSSNLQVNDAIVFNCNGAILDPLQIGIVYYIKSVYYNGSSSVITLSEVPNGPVLNLTPPSGSLGILKAYNKYFPVHVERDGFSSNVYNNILNIPIDDFGPAINIPIISGVGGVIIVTISDPSGVDSSKTVINNGNIIGSAIDVYGDSTVLEYNVLVTSVGTFTVIASDYAGNESIANQTVIIPTLPTIFITGYTITSSGSFLLNVKVSDNNTPAIIANNNSSQGIFVEGSISNTPYGTIKSINAVSDGVVFQLLVSSIGSGIMKIYATDSDNNTNMISPPVLTSISPLCGTTGTIVTFNGVNLGQSPIDLPSYQIVQSTVSSTGFKAKIIKTVDGVCVIAVKETVGSRDFISNQLTFLLKNTKPIINVIGNQIVEINQYSGSYNDQGATATDGITDLTNQIIISGVNNVDTTKLGVYFITYTVSDGCGNIASAQRVVNVVSGCLSSNKLTISAYPSAAYVGDTITIQADTGSFNSTYTNNVVTFSGVIAEIISGDSSQLKVLIPTGAASGDLVVETFNDCTASIVYDVLYNDITFDTYKVAYNVEKRYSTTALTYSVFQPEIMTRPIYNIDYSYSYFTPVVDENSMVQNVMTIILTQVGERIFNPLFGTTIASKVFALIQQPLGFENEVLTEISNAVNMYEPRVKVLIPQSFVVWDEGSNSMKVVLALLMPMGSVKKVGLTIRNSNANGVY